MQCALCNLQNDHGSKRQCKPGISITIKANLLTNYVERVDERRYTHVRDGQVDNEETSNFS